MVAVRERISGTGTATEGFGSSKGTGSVEAVEIFEDTGGEILTVVDTGTVWDTETAGTVGDTVAVDFDCVVSAGLSFGESHVLPSAE